MMSSTASRGISAKTPAIAASSLRVGMTTATRGRLIVLEAPAQTAAGACRRWRVAQQRRAKILVARPVPDFPQALLGRVAQSEAVVTAHRKRRDAARDRPAVRGEIHQRPWAAAQRPWPCRVVRREAAD